MLRNEEMIAPDALICNGDGFVWPAMFHFLPEDATNGLAQTVARDHGFEISGHHMSDDDPLYPEYEAGSSEVVGKWQPEIPNGWQLGGKHDTEDGPYVFFLRKLENPPAADLDDSGV